MLFSAVRSAQYVNVRQWRHAPDPLFERRMSCSSPPSEAPEIGRGLRDVRVPEPALNRRQRNPRIHPARARLAPQIVKVQIVDLGAATRQPPRRLDRVPPAARSRRRRRRPSGGSSSPAGSIRRRSSTWRSTARDRHAPIALRLRLRAPAGTSRPAARTAPGATAARASRPAACRSRAPPMMRSARPASGLAGAVRLRRAAGAGSGLPRAPS